MPFSGPILYLEDDPDDQHLFKEVFDELGIKNELMFFDESRDLLHYLRTTTIRPFLILSDVNLPGMNGFELRAEICRDEYLRDKCIPYIFLSTSGNKQMINRAYTMQVQGYFQKESTMEGIKRMMEQIMGYWMVCKHPDFDAN